jgi:hypothetical protein
LSCIDGHVIWETKAAADPNLFTTLIFKGYNIAPYAGTLIPGATLADLTLVGTAANQTKPDTPITIPSQVIWSGTGTPMNFQIDDDFYFGDTFNSVSGNFAWFENGAAAVNALPTGSYIIAGTASDSGNPQYFRMVVAGTICKTGQVGGANDDLSKSLTHHINLKFFPAANLIIMKATCAGNVKGDFYASYSGDYKNILKQNRGRGWSSIQGYTMKLTNIKFMK